MSSSLQPSSPEEFNVIDTNINYDIFGEGDLPVDEFLLNNITEVQRQQARAMMKAGYYQDGIFVDKFVREDLSINLERLEFAVTLSIIMLEANSDDDVTIKLRGLDKYYETRGIAGMKIREREERTFLLGFITSVASEASKKDTLEVKYVR